MMVTEEQTDYQLRIRSIGLATGEVFVLNECVRMWGIIGTVKLIRQVEDGFVIDVWRRKTPLNETEVNEVTIVKIPSNSVLWVAAGHLTVDSEGQILSEEE